MKGNLSKAIPGIQTVTLTFQNIYDDIWAAFKKPLYQGGRPRIIMPDGFMPELGKTYECTTHSTMTGTFTYNGIIYDLVYARWVEAANPIEIIHHKLEAIGNAPRNNPFAEALKGIDRSKLAQVEIVELQVQRNEKKGGLMFVPQYLESDPHADGLPTMRFYWPDEKTNKNVNLELGKTYRAKIIRVHQSGKETRKKALIIHVFVEVIA